jgi:hypothetical protein
MVEYHEERIEKVKELRFGGGQNYFTNEACEFVG